MKTFRVEGDSGVPAVSAGERGQTISTHFEIQSQWGTTVGWGFVDRADSLDEARSLLEKEYLPRSRNGSVDYRIMMKTTITVVVYPVPTGTTEPEIATESTNQQKEK
jgi:hypothetical protein